MTLISDGGGTRSKVSFRTISSNSSEYAWRQFGSRNASLMVDGSGLESVVIVVRETLVKGFLIWFLALMVMLCTFWVRFYGGRGLASGGCVSGGVGCDNGEGVGVGLLVGVGLGCVSVIGDACVDDKGATARDDGR